MNPRPPVPLPVLSLDWPQGPECEEVIHQEWLITNGLGGYASGTLGLCNTRRFHGLYIPTLPGRGRTVMLSRMVEEVIADERVYRLDSEERADHSIADANLRLLRSFRLQGLIPTWRFEFDGAQLERRMVMVHGENTVFIAYRHLGGRPLKLRLRPFPVFRPHDAPIPGQPFNPTMKVAGGNLEMQTAEDHPPLRLRLLSAAQDSAFVVRYHRSPELHFRLEKARGYDHGEHQVSPGYFRCSLREGEVVSLGISGGGWELLDRAPEEPFALEREREQMLLNRAPPQARAGNAARLVLAADQFVIQPFNRPADSAWARAVGQDVRSVIAGYHWFTDWGRDTMISLEGLTLTTGRHAEAAAILHTFRHYVKDGLLPNLFPEGESEGLYHTADATLWFFHAVDRYAEVTGDLDLVREFFPTLEGIISKHLEGTRFNIGADADGLIRQGQEGYQLTWMDAKVDGWVVTPRRGKPVEINALWFNALSLMADWATRLGKDPSRYAGLAEKAYGAFNRRFWNPQQGCLYDVVDGEGGDDAAIRPNQVFALSLRHPVLRKDRWQPVMEKVRQTLLTPVGLRSLSADHPDYKPRYDGDLRARDAAYHQGTVWGWLIGHYVDAQLKLDPDKQKARELLRGLEEHLELAGIGQVSEVFDATAPYRARGCIAQAWSVAELLRQLVKTT